MSCKDMDVIYKVMGVLVIALGMGGLYFNVEYSGWVLLVGLLMVM